jgi:hypothetical protein
MLNMDKTEAPAQMRAGRTVLEIATRAVMAELVENQEFHASPVRESLEVWCEPGDMQVQVVKTEAVARAALQAIDNASDDVFAQEYAAARAGGNLDACAAALSRRLRQMDKRCRAANARADGLAKDKALLLDATREIAADNAHLHERLRMVESGLARNGATLPPALVDASTTFTQLVVGICRGKGERKVAIAEKVADIRDIAYGIGLLEGEQRARGSADDEERDEVFTKSKWRHTRTGGEYAEVGRAGLHIDKHNRVCEGDTLVIYQGDDGRLWAREAGEFGDGRFEPLPTPGAAK